MEKKALYNTLRKTKQTYTPIVFKMVKELKDIYFGTILWTILVSKQVFQESNDAVGHSPFWQKNSLLLLLSMDIY